MIALLLGIVESIAKLAEDSNDNHINKRDAR